MSKHFLIVTCSFLVSSCATTSPPPVEAYSAKAILRVAADSGYVTNISFTKTQELKCGASGEFMLGWFHPTADGSWQRDRRLFGARQNMHLRANVPENMYAEHVVQVNGPFFVQFGAALANCSGVVALDLKQDRQYEFLLEVKPGVCSPKLFEFQKNGAGVNRIEVPLATPVRSFQCGY